MATRAPAQPTIPEAAQNAFDSFDSFDAFPYAPTDRRPDAFRLLVAPPTDAPMVGRYPMRDGPTLEISTSEWGSSALRYLRLLKKPSLAVKATSAGMLATVFCHLTGESVVGTWQIDENTAAARQRLLASDGTLNIVLRCDRTSLAGANTYGVCLRGMQEVWLPAEETTSKKGGAKPRTQRYAIGGVTTPVAVPSKLLVEAGLDGSSFPVRRLLLLPSDTTLSGLCRELLSAFGWDGSHMSEFRHGRAEIDGGRWGELTLASLYESKMRALTWLYDFGDSWYHEVRIKLPKPAHLAADRVVLEAVGPDMVDDVGGFWGLENLVANHAEWMAAKPAKRRAFEYHDLYASGWRPDTNKWSAK